MVLAVLFGLGYVTWRAIATLNPGQPMLSGTLLLVEAWGLGTMALHFFSVWDPFSRPAPPPVPPGLSVDVFVPTVNEPVWLVRRTLLGVLNIDYPHQTWLLDDGDRVEMRVLAQELGVRYVARASREGAKAGNLNHALALSKADFVAVFDADHMPLPHFLDRTLGYFTDERVAFVQTPQEFYNPDSYEHAWDPRKRRTWHDQLLFYRLIQPGKDRWNASFFCGSCGVIRRAALDEVGGVPTDTVTEDLHLSMLLHARGWRSVYQQEVLAYGLAPHTAPDYRRQRVRWGQGGMQVARRANPLTLPGLSLPQRLCYLSSILHWFEGWFRLALLLIPPVFLLTGALPLLADVRVFAPLFVTNYLLLAAAYRQAGRGRTRLLLSEAHAIARIDAYIKATFGLVRRRPLRFAVTSKEGRAQVPLRAVALHLGIVALTLLAMGVGVRRVVTGQEHRLLAVSVNLVWCAWHLVLLAWAIRHVLKTRERRKVHRARGPLAVEWAAGDRHGLGLLEDVSEYGGRLVTADEVPEGADIELRIWPTAYQLLRARVVWRREDPDHARAGLRWTGLDPSPDAGDLAASVMMLAQRTFMEEIDWLGGCAQRREGCTTAARSGAVPVFVPATGCVALLTSFDDGRRELWTGTPVTPGGMVEVQPWHHQARVALRLGTVRAMAAQPYVLLRAEVLEEQPAAASLPVDAGVRGLSLIGTIGARSASGAAARAGSSVD